MRDRPWDIVVIAGPRALLVIKETSGSPHPAEVAYKETHPAMVHRVVTSTSQAHGGVEAIQNSTHSTYGPLNHSSADDQI